MSPCSAVALPCPTRLYVLMPQVATLLVSASLYHSGLGPKTLSCDSLLSALKAFGRGTVNSWMLISNVFFFSLQVTLGKKIYTTYLLFCKPKKKKKKPLHRAISLIVLMVSLYQCMSNVEQLRDKCKLNVIIISADTQSCCYNVT